MSAAVRNAVVIEIPGTLDKRLSPNSRTPERTRNRLRRAFRDHVALTARAWRNNAGLFGEEPIIVCPATIHVVVYWEPGRMIWDQDNLIAACKGLPDGLTLAGVLDDDRHLTWLPVTQVKAANESGAIHVFIERTQP